MLTINFETHLQKASVTASSCYLIAFQMAGWLAGWLASWLTGFSYFLRLNELCDTGARNGYYYYYDHYYCGFMARCFKHLLRWGIMLRVFGRRAEPHHWQPIQQQEAIQTMKTMCECEQTNTNENDSEPRSSGHS